MALKKRIYYGWWILGSSIVIVYLSGTILFGFPVYYPFLIASFGWSRSQLLFGNTILQWVFGLTGLAWGALAESVERAWCYRLAPALSQPHASCSEGCKSCGSSM